MSDQVRETLLPYGLGMKKLYTYEDYVRLPEGAPFQLIGGELIMTPAPGKRHQVILKTLVKLFDDYVASKDLGEVLFAPRDVYLAPRETYQPDLLFIQKERLGISAEDKVNGAPDLVVEVLSPSTAYYDLKKKYKAYEKYGVKEYWIVDPEDKSIEIFELVDGKFRMVVRSEETGEVQSLLLRGLTIMLESLFKEEKS